MLKDTDPIDMDIVNHFLSLAFHTAKRLLILINLGHINKKIIKN